jgi:DNA (cytosine-5)-methyltransferase 1
MQLTHGSLSTGICGFDLGAEANKIKTLWTCEIDELRKDIIRHVIPGATIHDDIRELSKPEYVDIISFGFPCQDISRANPNGKGIEGKKSGLWYEGWRVIRKCRPKVIIIENSPDLIHKGLTTILCQLAKAGYNAEWYVISCKRFGMPHIRKRLFVVAYSQKIRMDKKQVLDSGITKEHRSKKMEEQRKSEELPFWSGSGRIYSASFWKKMLTKFHNLDNGIPQNIYNGLVAAAGDTVSPKITAWIFGRIKERLAS